MLQSIDQYLNGTTMYRLIVYYLVALLFVAAWFGYFGVIPYHPFSIIGSAVFMSAVAYIVNGIFGKTFETPVNTESSLITGLILSLIISPPLVGHFTQSLPLLIWAPVLGMATKYIFTWRQKHLFNPAAFAVALTMFVLGSSASWWVGTQSMMIFVLLGGLLVMRKMRREQMVLSFLVSAFLMMIAMGLLKGASVWDATTRVVLQTPVFFFAFVMLTEPLTTPSRSVFRLLYGFIVGLLFAPFVHIGSVYSTPELALLVGNLFTFLVSPSGKVLGVLREKIKIASNTYDFLFSVPRKLSYAPGQYMSWTQGGTPSDDRGNRRYFTVASSPTENDLRIGVKFYPQSSSFKEHLLAMKLGESIAVTELSGDFVLPRNKKKKLAFIAGGIGVTPFRSMVKYMIDAKDARDVVLFYSNNLYQDIAYTDIFDEAYAMFGLRAVYTLTDIHYVPEDWHGKTGYVNHDMIVEEMPDYKERVFYVSGPHVFVDATKNNLETLGVKKRNIKTDYFPGF